ncbi:hypothetical protein QTP88_013585 [Uroleucon formosanum]
MENILRGVSRVQVYLDDIIICGSSRSECEENVNAVLECLNVYKVKNIPVVASSRLQRWAVILSSYQYEIQHKKVIDISNADALSRLPQCSNTGENECSILLLENLPLTYKEVSKKTSTDEVLKETCTECQCNQNDKKVSEKVYIPWENPSDSWKRVHIDFLEINQVKLLIIVDSFIKWIECFAMGSTMATKVIEVLENCFCRFGSPEIMVTDNGPLRLARYHPYTNSHTVHTSIKMSSTSDSTKQKTMRAHSNSERRVPPIIIKKSKKNEDNDDLDYYTTPNTEDEFRSPRRTSKIYDSPTKNLFTTPNRYSILDNTKTNDQEMFTFDDNTLHITLKLIIKTITQYSPK